jgi:hypothetical protein
MFCTSSVNKLRDLCGMMVPSGGSTRMSTELEPLTPAGEGLAITRQRAGALMMIGWFSVGMAVATIGILVGTELRSRYKFNRRTPYDFYSNAGEKQASEFGVGI